MQWASKVAALGPVHWWRFEELSGSTAADSAGSADGTVFGVELDVDPYAIGGLGNEQLGSAASFDGVDDWINVGRLDLDASDDEQTWMFVTNSLGGAGQDFGGIGVILGGSDGATWGIGLGLRAGQVHLGTLVGEVDSDPVIDGPTFVIVTVKWSTGVTGLYVDGSEVAFPDLPPGPAPSFDHAVGIGDTYAEPWGVTVGNFLEGTLDELTVFDRILDSNDVDDLWDAYNADPNELHVEGGAGASINLVAGGAGLAEALGPPELQAAWIGTDVQLNWNQLPSAVGYELERQVWSGGST